MSEFDFAADAAAKRADFLAFFGGWDRMTDVHKGLGVRKTQANENNVLGRVVARGRRQVFGVDYGAQAQFEAVNLFDHPRSITPHLLLLQPYASAVTVPAEVIAACLARVGSAARFIAFPPYNTEHCIGFLVYRADSRMSDDWLRSHPDFKPAAITTAREYDFRIGG